MKKLIKHSIIATVIVSFLFASFGINEPTKVFAATTPSLGAAATYGILASTYTNTTSGTTVNGDVGFTTGAPVHPAGTQTNYGSGAPYSTAGTDQGAALTNLAAQPCTFTFAPGAVNLSTDTTHGTIGVYNPGVYCTSGTGAASVGTAGLTLNGGGTYIFRIVGALTTAPNAIITMVGTSACDVFWTPTQATTLGTNNTFVGTVIDDAGITIGATTTWAGRALAFGGTVTTDTDTITAPTGCAASATLHVVKLVVNGNNGTAVASNFNISVQSAGVNVPGSPAAGATGLGTAYALNAGTYVVSEAANSSYTQTFSGACDASGSVTLAPGDDRICTIINTNIPPPAPTFSTAGRIVPLIGILKVPTPLALPLGSGSVTYNYVVWNVGGQQALTSISVVDDKCSPVAFLSGDINNNGKLDPDENWKYSCTTTLSNTSTNTAIATGYSDDAFHQAAIATAVATVVVGAPITPPLINIVKVPSRLTPFPFGGGSVTYTYVVTNPGVVPIQNVVVTDDKCTPVVGVSGDTNGNNMLDPTESWTYRCTMNITASTRNIATVEGRANGIPAVAYAFATVLVSAPSLPNTGLPPTRSSTAWEFVLLTGALAGASLYTRSMWLGRSEESKQGINETV